MTKNFNTISLFPLIFVSGLGACDQTLDLDLRSNLGGLLDTSSAARNASTVMPTPDERGVIKFIRDMEMNPDYQCGIMISLTSSIADKEKGVIKPMISPEYLDDGRPVIFIHPGENSSLIDCDELIFIGIQTIVSIVKNIKTNNKWSAVMQNNTLINKLSTIITKLKKDYSEVKSDEIRRAKQLLECLESKSQQLLIDNISFMFNQLIEITIAPENIIT